MDDIRIRIIDDLTVALDRTVAFAGDMTPAMAEIANFQATQTRLRFREQASPLGVPWLQSERAKKEGGLTLVDRGDLFGSIKSAWGRLVAQAGPEASGGAAIYAAVHQWGARIVAGAKRALKTPFGPRGAVTIPARPYVGWNDFMIDRAVDILRDHALRSIGGAAA